MIVDRKALAEQRLLHVYGRLNDEVTLELVDLSIENLLSSQGSYDGSLMTLQSHAEVCAIHSWFSRGDLRSAKNWFWTAAVIQRARLRHTDPETSFLSFATYESLPAAVSEDESIRVAIGQIAEDLHAARKSAPINLISQQIGLILQGRGSSAAQTLGGLAAGGSLVAINGPLGPDLEVFHAMHFGSDADLVAALERICSLSLTAPRLNLESGFTGGLVSTPATLYLRLAWLLGRTVTLDDSLVPMEWMPVASADDLELQFPRLYQLLVGNDDDRMIN